MVWGAAIAAGASLLGGAHQASQQTGASTQQRHFTREMWQKQMDASNTAHQRQVKDLRAAGLNPILSARLGGASTPTAGSYQQPQYQNIGAAMAQAGTQAHTAQAAHNMQNSQTALNTEAVQKTRSEVTQLKAQTGLTKANTKVAMEVITNMQLEAEKIRASTEQVQNSAKLMSAQTTGQNLANTEKQIMLDLYNKAEIFKYIGTLGLKGAAAAETYQLIERWIKQHDTAVPPINRHSAKSANRRSSTRRNKYQ